MIDYDVIIVGSGPAGMNACLYASRAKLKTLVIERNYPGGKVVKTNKIENWIGTESIDGPSLALQMFKHSFSFGGVYEQNNVLDIIDHIDYKEVFVEDKSYKCHAVIICIGTTERKVGIPGEETFYGKGVSYCATCDGALYKNKPMVVIGNSEYAANEASYLSDFASRVTLVNSKDTLNVNEDKLKELENQNIEVRNNCKVISINGEEHVESITTDDGEDIATDVVFPLIGSRPDSMFYSRLKITDDNSYILVNEKQETKIKGIYAAGDCTNAPLKQISTAVGAGAIAATEAYKYIKSINKKLDK